MQPHQSTQCIQLLYPLVQQLSEQLDGFIHHLDQVKQAIASNQKDQLDQLVGHTEQDLATIEQLQLKQQQTVASFGFEQSPEGVNHCVKACSQPQLSERFDHLKEQLVTLQNALMINDLLIRKNQQRVRQSIRLLSGHAPATQNTTYTRKGDTQQDANDSHSLARA